LRNRRLVVIATLCVLCVAGAGTCLTYRYRQWSSPEALIVRAARAVKNDDLGTAQILIRNAIRLDPDNVEARIQIANILNRLSDEHVVGDVPAAVEQIAHAAKLQPDDLELQTRLFYGWHRLGRRDAATTTARRLADLESADPIALMYVIDDELDQGHLESAGRLINRLEQAVTDQSIAFIARRLRLLELTNDEESLQAQCELFAQRLIETRDSDLAKVGTSVIAMFPSISTRYLDKSPDGELAPRSTAVIRLIRRLLGIRPENENLLPLVNLAERIVAVNVSRQDNDPVAVRNLHAEFVETGRWLIGSKHYPRYLSSAFALLLYHSAAVVESPDFAVLILPALIAERDGAQSWAPTAEQQDGLIAYHATALSRVLGTDTEDAARDGLQQLHAHESTMSTALLLSALLAAHDGDTELAREHLDAAAKDDRIDPHLILALRCQCDIRTKDWKPVADALASLDGKEIDLRQAELLRALLGPPEQRRLTRLTALLELNQFAAADELLQTLVGSDVYASGHLIRIVYELRKGDLVEAQARLNAARVDDPDATAFVIADVAIAAAAGRRNEIESRMVDHLIRRPEDLRVRMLLARWYQATGRTGDAVTQYSDMTQLRPGLLHAWVMAALLLHTSDQQQELDALIKGMAGTPEVAEYADRLRQQITSFAIRMRRNKSDSKLALEAVELLQVDSSQSVRDWRLLNVAVRASQADGGPGVLAQMQYLLTTGGDREAGENVLDRLEGGMLAALSDIADSDAADMQRRISELVGKHPDQPGPHIAAIVYFANRDDVPNAWKHAQALARIDPISGRAQYWFARLLAVSYRIDEAVEQLNASLQRADRPDARLFGVRLELFRDQPEQALEHLDRLPGPLSSQFAPVVLRFETLRRLEQHDRAADVLTEFLQREPQHISLWLRLAEHYDRESGGDQAIRLVSTALQQHPQHSGLRSKLLGLLVRHDRLDQAETLARQLAETPDHPETPLSLALAFLTAGEVDAGTAWLNRVDVASANPFQYAMAVYQQGQAGNDRALIERAGSLLEQLASQSPDSLPVLNNLAWLLAVDLGRPDVALPIVERIVALSDVGDVDPNFVDTIAEVLVANDRAADALSIVRKSVLQHPADGVLRYHSGVLQLTLARNQVQIKPALQDLAMARRLTRLSVRRDAYVASALERYGKAP